MSVDEAEKTLVRLKRNYLLEVLNLLEARGHDQETLEAFTTILDDADQLSAEEIDGLRGSPEGDAIAETVVKIQRMHHLTQPVPASGWLKQARVVLTLCLIVAGWLSAPTSTLPFGGLVGACLGFLIGTLFGYHHLGGRPERRHAVSALLTKTSQSRWAAVGASLGPSPHKTSLAKLRGEGAND